ncbi:hypothetical protein EFT87_11505 [Schleiferilactobacillus harbinensis]|uniref:hypothetical protein n=1 Tax=Schleiferilactobacillus harbinensis TaxID=304207 RepID=UPI0021A2BE26|nr:hypothetical protein [Schleiferilactobacillus harbinensis]MCT2909276.1 hypothetical protein [Schleiferilactobacillus harbinensis]
MKDFDNVKDALADLIEIVESLDFQHEDGTLLSANEVLELAAEDVYQIADLLGLSDLYLDKLGKHDNEKQ